MNHLLPGVWRFGYLNSSLDKGQMKSSRNVPLLYSHISMYQWRIWKNSWILYFCCTKCLDLEWVHSHNLPWNFCLKIRNLRFEIQRKLVENYPKTWFQYSFTNETCFKLIPNLSQTNWASSASLELEQWPISSVESQFFMKTAWISKPLDIGINIEI